MSASRVGASLRKVLSQLNVLMVLLVAAVFALGGQAGDVGALVTPSADDAAHRPAWLNKAEHLNTRYECSHTELAPGLIPAHAVVKVGRQVRLTTFDEGWAIYHDKRPGRLLSVCAR